MRENPAMLTRRKALGFGCVAAASLAVASSPLGVAFAASETPAEPETTSRPEGLTEAAEREYPFPTVKFGSWQQAADGDPEPIEWLVLDEKDSSKLLLSKYAIDCRSYNEERVDICWADCTLRSWLNGEFLQGAFTDEERSSIVETLIANDDNPVYGTEAGPDTTDSVFCLSLAEAEKYFGAKAGEASEDLIAFPTDYAVAHGAFVSWETGSCFWLLRSPGYGPVWSALVFNDGFVNVVGNFVVGDDFAVRPALWVSGL